MLPGIVVSHYCLGAAYPVGGPGRIAQLILSVIENKGGRAVTRATVESILIEDKVATGVIVRGHVIRGKKLVSTIGAFHTFTKLLPPEIAASYPFLIEVRKTLENDDVKSSPSHAMTFLTLKGTATSLGLPKANWWIQDDPRFASVFISFPSAKDPTWTKRHPEISVCEIVVEIPTETFETWKDDHTKNRPPEYLKIKEELANTMCEILFKQFPHLNGKVDFREASTPLSAEHFLGSHKGCAYGLACIPARYRVHWLQPATEIPNLYLGGQDITSCGIAGGQMGGLIAACSANRRNSLALRKNFHF